MGWWCTLANKSWEVKVDVSAIKQATSQAAEKALFLAAEHVLSVSTRKVPHDRGTLQNSGRTSVDGKNLRAVVSYNTPYAVRQHEDMTLRHGGGRSAKYLESSLNGEMAKVRQIIVDAMTGAWS